MVTKEGWVRRKERYGKSGSKNPEQTKERMSKSKMGHPTSEETKKKINEVLKFGGYKVIRIWESEIKIMKLNDLKEKLI